MKNPGRLANLFIFAVLLFGAASTAAQAQHVIDDAKTPEFLFTMSATSGSLEDNKLTLNGIPLVVYFSDRPYRIAGHMSLEDFGALWNEGTDSFSKDPPNAQLAIYGESGDSHALLIISAPEISGTSISFSVKVLEGDLPETFGQATLFIDPDTVAPMIT